MLSLALDLNQKIALRESNFFGGVGKFTLNQMIIPRKFSQSSLVRFPESSSAYEAANTPLWLVGVLVYSSCDKTEVHRRQSLIPNGDCIAPTGLAKVSCCKIAWLLKKSSQQNIFPAANVPCRVFAFPHSLSGNLNRWCGWAEEPYQSLDVLRSCCKEELLTHELQSPQAQAT